MTTPQYTWTNDRMWRKNRFQHPDDKCVGVDINRNFPDGFKHVSRESGCNCGDSIIIIMG